MKKAGLDPKVKKTLIRNYERKVRSGPQVVHDVCAGPSEKARIPNEAKLEHPTLCSSEILANYLSDVRNCTPCLTSENLDVDKAQISSKVTKKLNFHFNDKIYKNLVELNSNVANEKNKKEKKTTNASKIKKDLEPNIEDFCQTEKEKDLSPNIPLIKHKFKPIRPVEDGQLHKLITSFENL